MCCTKEKRELDDNDMLSFLLDETLNSPEKELKSLDSHVECISSQSSTTTKISDTSIASSECSNASGATHRMAGWSGKRVHFKFPVQTYSYITE